MPQVGSRKRVAEPGRKGQKALLQGDMTMLDLHLTRHPAMPEADADDDRWRAVRARERSADGRFWYGVLTTGIYCRPQCPSRPARRNVRFYLSREEARAAGLRACKRCHPDAD